MASNSWHQKWNGKLGVPPLAFLLVRLVVVLGVASAENKVNDHKLPRNIVPENYKIVLHPFMVEKNFQGTVSITLDVLKPTNTITLHSKNLTIETCYLLNDKNKNITVTSFNEITEQEFLRIFLETRILKGKYVLYVKFVGSLERNTSVGFYSSSSSINGRTMVASKFEPTYARQAFPCFDEPEFKATYDTTLIKPEGYVALSNMNEISTDVDSQTNTEAVHFATSVPMSTYLACFVICDFDHKQTQINAHGIGNNFTMRTFAQKDQLHKIDFALDIGKRATEFYIKYYEVPFPLPKLDMIAIPDYQSGATEHWGLITYRETSFLIDQVTSSSQDKMSVANTIAHELAHMWFGNLVTMKWWNDIWLNEGFASYMQVKALHNIEPSWRSLDQFLPRTMHSALSIDAKLSSHPIVQTVNTPDEITAIFDAISYNKGSSVLRMLENFIGEENFRNGVSDYLKKFKYGSTVTEDLLHCLEPYFKKENNALSISYIMDTWTLQMGYPVLSVQKSDENKVIITQSRFLIDPSSASNSNETNDSPFNYRWFVPITYKTNNGESKELLWFPDTAENVSIRLKEGDKWLKINNNQVGFYRVNYPTEMWGDLIQALKQKSDALTVSDRTHLINDAFALAESLSLPYSVPLDLTTYLTVEEDYVPWHTAGSALAGIEDRLRDTNSANQLREYLRRLVEPLYKKQSWEKEKSSNDGAYNELLRVRIFKLAARAQLPDAMAKTKEMFIHWLNTRELMDPEVSELVYINGMKSATQEEWNKTWEIYLNETDAQEMQKLRLALSTPHDTDILKRYLDLAWDEKNIRSQDYLSVVRYIAHNSYGTKLVWDDVRARWPQLVERFTLNSRYLGNMIVFVTEHFNTDEQLKELKDFFFKYPEAGAGAASRRRALESVRANVRWTSAAGPDIDDWLRKQNA